MKKKLTLLGFAFLAMELVCGQNVSPNPLPDNNPLRDHIDSVIQEKVKAFFDQAKAPGLIIGISRAGQRQYYCYGYADPATKKMFGPKTIGEIGSITKTFTANLLLQLSQKGLLQVNDPVTRFIPENSNDTLLQKIILADLASQVSGLPRLPANLDKVKGYKAAQPYAHYNREDLYSFLASLKTLHPGTYNYSNLGFGLLGTVLENVTHSTYSSLVQQYIFHPLGMNNSYVDMVEKNADTATGFLNGKPVDYWLFDCLGGAGSIKSNAEDMLTYLEACLSSPEPAFGNAVREALQQRAVVGLGMHIGYAWHSIDNLPHPAWWHNGGTYGFSSFAAIEPQSKTAIILFSNTFNVNNQLDLLSVELLILLTGK